MLLIVGAILSLALAAWAATPAVAILALGAWHGDLGFALAWLLTYGGFLLLGAGMQSAGAVLALQAVRRVRVRPAAWRRGLVGGILALQPLIVVGAFMCRPPGTGNPMDPRDPA